MRSAMLAVTAVLAAAGSSYAGVRVAHLSPDTPAVNVRFGAAGGPLSTIINNLTYTNLAPAQGSTGAYLPVPTGSYDIRVDAPSLGAAGTGAISVNSLALNGSTNYTIAAVGTLGSLLNNTGPVTAPLQPQVYVDDNTIAPGQARIRFIHASANTPAVDIVLDQAGNNNPGNPVLFGNVARFASGGYITVPAGTYKLDAFLNDRSILSTPALNDLSLTVAADTVYTVWAVGLNALVGQQPTAGQELGVAVTVDAIPSPSAAGLLALAGIAAARRRR
jgi:MYXO-CTERM domain-containing protein